MRSFIFILLATGSCWSLHAQSFAVKADYTTGSPVLRKIKGDTPNSHFYFPSGWSASLGAEYQFRSGFFIAGTVSYQKDIFSMSETSFEYQPLLGFTKTYATTALNAGIGYSYPIGTTHLSAFGLASMGAGLVQSEQVTNWFNMSGETYVQTNEASFVDTVQIHYTLTDEEVRDVRMKFDCSAGLEYKWEHLFCRVYAGIQLWASPLSEVTYSTIHSSEHYDSHRRSEGNFSVRPGYVAGGATLGWRFGSSEE